MNEEFGVHCKEVTTQLFTVVVIIVELGKSITKPKGCLEASPSIM